MINIVCVNNGGKYGDDYTNKLYAMTERYLQRPFQLTCFTDRPRPLHENIHQYSIAHWGLPGWFAKLKLFDGTAIPFDSFLYLDITLIIKQSLEPLIDFTYGKPFVAQQDWWYDCFNSSVMWITRHAMNQCVWDTFASGKKYRTHHHGDQDYIHAVYKEHDLLRQIDYFPQDFVQSYKDLVRKRRGDRVAVDQAVQDAIIIKFHGHPKPHELLGSNSEFLKLQLQHPALLFQDWSYLHNEICEWWRL